MSTKCMTLYSLYVLEVYSDNAVTFLMHVCIHIYSTLYYTLTYPGNMHSVTTGILCHPCQYYYITLVSLQFTPLHMLFLFVCIDAGERPTGQPTEHQATHPPLRARRSESAAPATLTCWSDPDPVAEEGSAQGAVGSAFNITGSISK